MPWDVKRDDRCPTAKPWGVVKQDDNALEGCHASEDDAKQQQKALYARESRAVGTEDEVPVVEQPVSRPPRENLARAMAPSTSQVEVDDTGSTMRGYFARFNSWYPVDSVMEGHFIESIEPGAFKKAISETRGKLQVLFHHGMDPSFGLKPLGPIRDIGEDDSGAFYEVDLLDTSYNRDLIPGLRAGLYGSSFRFNVPGRDKERFEAMPKRSSYNPDGLPERRIFEVQLKDVGPTPFPVNPDTPTGVRSETDALLIAAFAAEPDRLRALLSQVNIALPEAEPTDMVTPQGGAAAPVVTPPPPRFRSDADWLAFLGVPTHD